MEKEIDLGNSWIRIRVREDEILEIIFEARNMVSAVINIHANDAEKIIELGECLTEVGKKLNA